MSDETRPRHSRDGRRAMDTAHRVDGEVFIGGYRAAADAGFVRRMGFTRIVKMFADDTSYPGGRHRHPGVRYFVAAAEDLPEYDIRSDAAAAVRFVHEGVAAGERVFVHCHAGISRSATIVLLWLMTRPSGRLDLASALALLRRVRPFVRPNDGFMRHLRATDQRIAALARPT